MTSTNTDDNPGINLPDKAIIVELIVQGAFCFGINKRFLNLPLALYR